MAVRPTTMDHVLGHRAFWKVCGQPTQTAAALERLPMIPIRDSIPSRYPPLTIWALVGFNALIFMFEISLPPQQLDGFMHVFGVVPASFARFPAELSIAVWLPLLTNMFLHGGWLHIVGNMWVLWIFGDNVEDRMGHGRFLVFYVLCGLAASLTHVLMNRSSNVPSLGASGAIAGVMGAYLLMFPYARVVVMIPIFIFPFFFQLHALVFIVFWFFIQLFSGALSLVGPESTGGVAWWAHVGGLIAGILLRPLFDREYGRRRRFYPDEGWIETSWGRS